MAKIAVCLSGQLRTVKYTIQSAVNFFKGDHEYDFFCHAWDYNDYKIKHPVNRSIVWKRENIENIDEYYQLINQSLSPKKLVINDNSYLDKQKRRFGWDSMMYSAMLANHFKKEYEIENNFRYDYVIKTRYDLVYKPFKTFALDSRFTHFDFIKELDLFVCHAGRMLYEYMRVNFSDVIFYGSSIAMDIASDLYWYMYASNFFKLDDCNHLGPGTHMSRFVSTNGLRFKDNIDVGEVVYRLSAIPLDVVNDYDKIFEHHSKMYR
jgi:hypothetical protein